MRRHFAHVSLISVIPVDFMSKIIDRNVHRVVKYDKVEELCNDGKGQLRQMTDQGCPFPFSRLERTPNES